MKKILISIIAILSVIQAGYAQLTVKVDEKFELTSTVFFMAGVPEYWNCAIPSYRRDIIKELSPYELTEPIHFIRELNIQHAIGYNAVSTTADMLEIKNGKIRLQSQYDIAEIAQYDSRWTPELFAKYIKMLNIFYKQSNFHKFYTSHAELYKLAEDRINSHIAGTATEWFKSFYGKELSPDIKIYISLVNGPSNYAINSGVLLGMMCDKDSLPAANPSTVSVLIHELGHHYANPIVDSYWHQMEASANKIFPHVKDQMRKIAYGDAKTTMVEWLNRLFVLMYSKETGDDWYRANLSRELKNGFIWMERSVKFMDNFYANRDKYPTVEDFMPQLIGFLNYTADNFDFVLREIEISRPYITNIYPILESDITDASEVVITFSEPMLGSYGFMGWPSNTIPIEFDFKNIHWSKDYRKCTIPLFPDKMEKGKAYGIKLSSKAFISAKYFWLDDKCVDLIFKPKSE